MQPLNQPERRTRLWHFALLYLLALLVPLGASYYLFSNNSLAEENAALKQKLDRTHQEQQQLVARFDTLGRYLQRIDLVDQRMRDVDNPIVLSRLVTTNEDYLSTIAAGLSQLRLDSAQLQIPAHRLLVRDELRDFDLFRANRSAIDALRQQLARSGDAVKENARLAEELARAQQRIILLEATARQQPPAAGGGAGGGGAPVAPPPSSVAKQQIALLQGQLAFANADCIRQRAEGKSRKERKRLLEESRTQFIKILQEPATEDLKQSVEKTLEPINLELGRPPHFFGLIPD